MDNTNPDINPEPTPASATPTAPQHTNQAQPTLPTQTTSKEKSHPRLTILILAASVVILVIFAWLRFTVFGLYQENGPSMDPAIKSGQKVYILRGHSQPKRGAIIIFKASGLSKYGQPNTLNLTKRVVGLPGDRIVIKNGQVRVFNSTNPNGFNPDNGYSIQGSTTSPGGTINTTVPRGDVYVLGDNRPDSLDSRELGSIPIANILGRVVNL